MNRPEHGSINAKDLIAHRPLSPTFVAYNHCHNTVHEDSAMLMRLQLLTGLAGSPQVAITDTPNPTPDGVTFTTPEILPEGDPRLPLRV